MRIFALLLFLMAPHILKQHGGRPQPSPDTVLQGIDVSHYQDIIEWDSVAADGKVDFAFVKATEGSDIVDTLFERNWEHLDRLGIRRGAYHFFRAYGCGYDQAEHFLSHVSYCSGDLAPVLDVERSDGIPQEVMLEEIRIWLQTVEHRLHVKPIIYTNQNFYERFLAGYFDSNPFWIARYSEERPILSTGKEWDIWQYSHKGILKGIPTYVDLNLFKGNLRQMDRLCYRPEDTTTTTLRQASVFSAP